MLDIDLEFLNFLLNPSYDYIKNDLKIIQDAYLEDVTLEVTSKKQANFNEVNYLFLTDIDSLAIFLKNFYLKTIRDIYINLGKFFSINLENDLIDNNFISNILLKNNIKKLDNDLGLNIFTTEITEYLINIAKNTNIEKERILAKDALIYMQELLNKKRQIVKVLAPKFNLVKEKLRKRKEIKEKLIKKIIREHAYLLSDKSKKVIYNNDDYDYQKLLENEDIFNLFFTFNKENTINHPFLKEKDLSKDLEELNKIILDPNFIYISNNTPYKGYSILIKLINDIKKYNLLYQDLISDLIFTISKDEIIKKAEDFIKKDCSNTLQYNLKMDLFEELVFKESNYNCFDTSLNLIIISPLSWIKISNNKISCELYYCLMHELGHVYDLEKTNYQIRKNLFKTNRYYLLYEIYNEYRAINKTNALIWKKDFVKQGFIHCPGLCIYQIYFCFFIDFLEKYNKEFAEYVATDDISTLENLIGKENFNNIINLINTFDYERFNEDLDYANEMFSSFDKYLEVKENKRLCMEKK